MATEQEGPPHEAESRPKILDDGPEEWQKRAEDVFKDLPPPSIPTLPGEQAFDLSKYKNKPDCTTAEAWQSCADAIQKYDADMCKAHREEIDTLLVFAGLFSAVVTAFTIESYQWLQDDPNDAIIALLSQLAQVPNSTRSAPSAAGLPGAVSARINAYWFLSLTFSLSAALVAILCKQWVREFERHAAQSHEQFIGIRQMKLEGFEGWGVPAIVAAIPLLLQSALALFAVGLIELLWHLHRRVAIIILTPSMAMFLFYAATTLLPAFQLISLASATRPTLPQCPFKSPQSMVAIRVLPLLLILRSWFAAGIRILSAALGALHGRIGASCGRRSMAYGGSPPDIDEEATPASSSSNNAAILAPDRRAFAPKSQHFQSWITLDGELCRVRDSLYTDEEYLLALNRSTNIPKVPAVACFRGLSWLRGHIDQPDLPRLISLSALDISFRATHTRDRSIALRTYHGILHLLPEPEDFRPDAFMLSLQLESDMSHRPLVRPLGLAALSYATVAGLNAPFVTELFIHHLDFMDIRFKEHLCGRLADIIRHFAHPDLGPSGGLRTRSREIYAFCRNLKGTYSLSAP